jgi:hypothetical protein
MTTLRDLGRDAEIVKLPGHGSDRFEAKNFEEALVLFKASMDKAVTGPWKAIAFSTGAVYLQHLLIENSIRPPSSQILLAPALRVHNYQIFKILLKLLPENVRIPSWSPKTVRRYSGLYLWEYRILFEAIKKNQSIDIVFPIPTLILIDPKDELVHAKELEVMSKRVDFKLIHRDYLWRPGHHHILFHPGYFSDPDWKEFVRRINNFLEK